MFVCFLWKNKCALDRGSLFDLLSPWLFLLFSPLSVSSFIQLHHFFLPGQLCALQPRYVDINELCWSCGVQQKQFSLAVNLLYGHFLSLAAVCWCCGEELQLAHTKSRPFTKAGLRGDQLPLQHTHPSSFLPALTQQLRGQSPPSPGT